MRPGLIERYAEVAVQVGVALRPGQVLFLTGEPEHAPLLRALAEAGWQAGAADVQVVYSDDHMRRLHALHAPEDLLDRTPEWLEAAVRSMEGAAAIATHGDADLDLFADVDQARAARAEPRRMKEAINDLIGRRAFAWCVIACPTAGWAASLFGTPDVERLWDEVAAVTRLDEPDPVAAWREHQDVLTHRAADLSAHAFDSLAFTGPGTDLRVGLLPGASWLAAMSVTSWGQKCCVNLPTEEVFTTPDRLRTEGVVRTTRPLHWYGSVAEDVELRFEDGAVVDVHATRGEEFLRTMLATDDGARFLGEVALVDGTSRVGRRGLVYRNGLFDENAACHVAIGGAYTEPVEGADVLTQAERVAAGLNHSLVHVDLMIGAADVDVDGVRTDGTRVPILREHAWVLPQPG